MSDFAINEETVQVQSVTQPHLQKSISLSIRLMIVLNVFYFVVGWAFLGLFRREVEGLQFSSVYVVERSVDSSIFFLVIFKSCMLLINISVPLNVSA